MKANKKDKGRYFVGHGMTKTQIKDLRGTIESALGPSQFTPLYADSKVEQHHILWKICENIYRADFGVFDLSSGRPNVYVELGISLGMNKPVFMIARKGSQEALDLLESYNLVYYSDYRELKDSLEDIARYVDRELAQRDADERDYCHFCNLVCPTMSSPRQPKQYLILKESGLLHRNLIEAITASLSQEGLAAVHLGQTELKGPTPLCNLRSKIASSHFVLFDLGDSPVTLFQCFALGMAIGVRAPWFLLVREGQTMPSILGGFDHFRYQDYAEIKAHLLERLAISDTGLEAQDPTNAASPMTAGLDRPFWLQLDEFILGQSQKPSSIDPDAPLYLLQVEGKTLRAKHRIKGKVASIGRDPSCDIPLPVRSVSALHAHVMQLGSGYQIQDNESTNGTFLNGARLAPLESAALRLEDTLTIGPYLFIVSDGQSIPDWIAARPAGKTTPLDASHPARQWNTAALRDLLTAAFSDEELLALCYDHFQAVYEQFSSVMSKPQMIQRLIEHCERQRTVGGLLALVRAHNPGQYEHFEARLKN